MALCVDAVSLERSGRKEERNVSVGVEEGRSDLLKAQNAKNKKKKKNPKNRPPLKLKSRSTSIKLPHAFAIFAVPVLHTVGRSAIVKGCIRLYVALWWTDELQCNQPSPTDCWD